MQRYPLVSTPLQAQAPLILLFERNDAVAVPLIPQLRMAGYDVRAARIPVEVFDILSREKIDLVLIDLGNAAANRREFWVGLDSQRRNRSVHVLTFRYMSTGETGELESGLRVARADVEVQSAQGFGQLVDAIRARVPGAVPVAQFGGPPPATPALPFPGMNGSGSPPTGTGGGNGSNPLAPQSRGSASNPLRPMGGGAMGGGDDDSPFAQPYSNNPFKSGGRPASAPLAANPFGAGRNGNGASAPSVASRSGNRVGMPGSLEDFAQGFGPASPPVQGNKANGNADGNAGRVRPPIDDAWTPPEPAAPRRGIAYRGYDDEPLAPDDPRIEGNTSVVPAVAYGQVERQGDARTERALSTILIDSAVMAPQRLDALRSIQQTLGAVGMEFTLGELALLFKFLTPDQLLAALLVSRGIVTAEEIASLGRIKQELSVSGKDYDLETLLVMFNVLTADEVQELKAELG